MSTFSRAIARTPATTFANGLTTADLGRPEHARMLDQHAAYVDSLTALGVDVVVLEPLDEFPDAHFVEDAAVVVAELAVITRPGAPARRGEELAIEGALAPHRAIHRIEAPGTLDGGDVLEVGGHFFIGLSERTNAEGADQLARILAGAGYPSSNVPVGAGLHLKSSVNALGERRLILTEALAASRHFEGFDLVVTPREEDYACNVVLVNGTVLMAAGFPQVNAQLAELGLPVVELDMSESCKMDGGLTCLSLRF
ncbi:MAG: arginine deiminase family protein [Planctomycetota bacterium]